MTYTEHEYLCFKRRQSEFEQDCHNMCRPLMYSDVFRVCYHTSLHCMNRRCVSLSFGRSGVRSSCLVGKRRTSNGCHALRIIFSVDPLQRQAIGNSQILSPTWCHTQHWRIYHKSRLFVVLGAHFRWSLPRSTLTTSVYNPPRLGYDCFQWSFTDFVQ